MACGGSKGVPVSVIGQELSSVGDDSSGSEGETEPAQAFHRKLSTRVKCSAPCTREGYLLKQTCRSSFQRWRRRYFRLRGRTLYYAKHAKAAIFDEIELNDASIAECVGRGGLDYLGFQVITSSRSLVLSAENRRDMEDWVAALRAASAGDFHAPEAVPGEEEGGAGPSGAACPTLSAQAEVLSGSHHWHATSHARPTYCNVCREALSGVTSHGLSCEVCKFKVHKRCAAKALNNCKWTTLASLGPEIVEDAEGNITMPHQWLEGNLPVSAKCLVCEKTCGSVLRLQDWRCLWCNALVHTACRPLHPVQCSLGPAKVSLVPPIALHSAGLEEAWEAGPSPGLASPLLVFVNSRSGDNQGLRFLRRFRQLLNPAQVFDLVNGGPGLGLRLFRHLNPFRVLVCGGDGSVGWVLTEIDRLCLHGQCRVGVLPLGTGNDLARVLGWGAACDHDANLPNLLERYEHATSKMLDRWSVLCLEREVLVHPPSSRKQSTVQPGDLTEEVEAEAEEEEAAQSSEVPSINVEHETTPEIKEISVEDTKHLCERAEKLLNETSKVEGEVLGEKLGVLQKQLRALREAVKELEEHAALSHESDGEEEEPQNKESKDWANSARHRRHSSRRKVKSTADSLQSTLKEAKALLVNKDDEPKDLMHELLQATGMTKESLMMGQEQPRRLSTTEILKATFLMQGPSELITHDLKPKDLSKESSPVSHLKPPEHQVSGTGYTFLSPSPSPEISRCPSPHQLHPSFPPSSFLSPTLTTNFPLLLTPISPAHSRSPSPLSLTQSRPVSPAQFSSTELGGSTPWLPPPPSMFADGSLVVTDTDEKPSTESLVEAEVVAPTSGAEVPCVVVSAPSPEHRPPSPPHEEDSDHLMFDPYFLSDLRRPSQDSCYSSRRSSAASRRISSAGLFHSDMHLIPPGSPTLGGHSRSPSPRGSMSQHACTSLTPQPEVNRKLPIINPLVRSPAWPNVSGGGAGGGAGGLISQALLANADTLCAAVSPLMDPDESLLEGFYERCVMNNYFGIGIDAKISLAFHQKREEHPEQCRSRARNYMWYGVLGSREALRRSCRKLEQRLSLECDGQRIPLPSLQGIVVLNIPSFMGGTNFWGGSKGDECFLAPSFDDRVLEVVAVFGSVQMAASRILSAQSHRIAQCSTVQISILGDEGVPVQVDGEAWVQPPGMIRIIHKNRMHMLCRNRALESSLRSWEEKQRQQHDKPLDKTPGTVTPPVITLGTNQTDDERLALLRFIEAASSLVKCVKLLSIVHLGLPTELYRRADQTSSRLEALHPGGKIVDGPDLPLLVTHLVTACRMLHEEACVAIGDLSAPAKSVNAEDDPGPKLSSALLAMASQLQMCHTDPETGLTMFLSEEQSKSRSPLPGLGWLKLRGLRRPSSEEGSKVPRVGRSAVENWGASEVGTWLTALGLTEYRDNFVQHDIQGRELLSLGRRDLRELGVEKLGHVKRILQGIKDLGGS